MFEIHEHHASLDVRLVNEPETGTDNLANAIVTTGWLAAGMIHDFRNPLGTIRSASEMDRHLSAIRRCIAFMLHGNRATEDLTQEVVLKAWRFLSAFRAESSFRTWLTRVAINEARQFQRRELRASNFQELSKLDVLASRDESPYEHFARIQRTGAVRAVVNSSPMHHPNGQESPVPRAVNASCRSSEITGRNFWQRARDVRRSVIQATN